MLYISHPNYAPRKLTRTSHTAWTLTKIAFEHGPYLDENVTATTITSNATSGNVTLTASANTFVSNHVGSIWELRQQIASEIDDFNQIIYEIRTYEEIPFIDVTTISRKVNIFPEWIAPDSLHPSGAQYSEWVKQIIPLFLK